MHTGRKNFGIPTTAPSILKAPAIRVTSTSSRHHIVIVPVRALCTGMPEGVLIRSAFSTKFVPSTLGQWMRTELLPVCEPLNVRAVVAFVLDDADGAGPPVACAHRAVGDPLAAAPNSRFSS